MRSGGNAWVYGEERDLGKEDGPRNAKNDLPAAATGITLTDKTSNTSNCISQDAAVLACCNRAVINDRANFVCQIRTNTSATPMFDFIKNIMLHAFGDLSTFLLVYNSFKYFIQIY